jgi:hypothetical protein
MLDLTLFFVLGVVLACGLASIAIWSPRKLWVKGTALAMAAALFGIGYAGFASMLSRPKPMSMAWAEQQIGEANLVGSSMVEGQAIYVWLQFDGSPEPRAFALPWDIRAAQQLQQALQEAEANGTGVRMKMSPGDAMDGGEARFWAKPQEPMPDKNYDATGPVIYQQPESHS